jgi:hypothetical protein
MRGNDEDESRNSSRSPNKRKGKPGESRNADKSKLSGKDTSTNGREKDEKETERGKNKSPDFEASERAGR